ncbi:DMT family transporter [Planococcus sp. CP5-4]|uniref:DMT family transporter n=1 Tax=unclassified Planococcus (in: firmicutes) TaxID=2662419 RepID=UPI001C23EA7A|nr:MULTISPECIES: DMT family transporter [unclassified Planococcus (in: firmicutes)]MBU9673400.1 DMT family transporter [Planococcus sp. CP5-4_YE]MBV0908173.1 DMT family transporter [Planococcus sp. CP5-4_UN]MBW6062234.1 DMT family transporter [Planococcus sp. CP5-4]
MVLGIILALSGGVFVCLQNIFNANVKQHVSVWTTTALVLFLGFSGSFIAGLAVNGKSLFLFEAETWFWFSGVLGVGVVVCVTQGVQALGPSRAISIVMVSQIFFGLMWDTAGWFGLEQVPFTWQSLFGVLLISAGILLFQLGPILERKSLAPQQKAPHEA